MRLSVPSASCSRMSPGVPEKVESRTSTREVEPAPMLTYSRPLAEKPPRPEVWV